MKRYKILIVEDAESILLAIQDYLRSWFDVYTAVSYARAMEIITTKRKEGIILDLIISDINLPDKNGFELIKKAKSLLPEIKTALITSYDINEYIEYIQKEEIDQVISKHSQLNLLDIKIMALKLLTNDIFGIQKYFESIKVYYPTETKPQENPGDGEIFSITIKSGADRIFWMNHIANFMIQQKHVSEAMIRLVLDEVTSNALVRSAKYPDGTYKYQRRIEERDILIPDAEVILQEEDYFILQYGFFGDWIIIATIDPQGTLRKKEILYRLKRHIEINNHTGVPFGFTDTHGRGIFLLREHLSNLVFNIFTNHKTEVLCMYNTRKEIPYKNISIFEIDDEYDY